jgi:hypothetical protein
MHSRLFPADHQSVTDIVHQGQNIGQQAQDIAHQF